MPELPEVETIARRLSQGMEGSPSLVGQRVQAAQVFWERSLARPSVGAFERQIIGQTVLGVRRRGKFLIIDLSEAALLIHLRMSGDLRVEDARTPAGSHERARLTLESGTSLAFDDARKFGRIWLVNDAEEVVGGLGPEPLEASFTWEVLYEGLQRRRRQLKPLLLDQTFIAGLGNIYTDEALHLARLHPLALSNRVSAAQAEGLWRGIRAALEEGIRRNGASIDWVYRGGDFQNYFRVYKRTGEACYTCGTSIARLVIGQRSSHFCPVCQAREAS
ncbi:MAG: bifunctional DNA-formamidopyrimidine glycosylase/DNA-(apurinic or apyrimidinic site) lyase [Anaerolineales bacterium]|nr:bifunctional DNA-formamidopyrimidine glycosylase/DNA-(apurinic or apyrimidinic site) lyase [Anaerolineales bacterium]